jgi:hypothetical protein
MEHRMSRSLSVCAVVLMGTWLWCGGCGAEGLGTGNEPVDYETWNADPNPDTDNLVAGVTVEAQGGSAPGISDDWLNTGGGQPEGSGGAGSGGPDSAPPAIGDPNGSGDPNQLGDPNELGDPNLVRNFPVTLMPWFEFCEHDDQHANALIDLCSYATRMTDTVIVVTDPGGEFIYDRLRQQLPSLKVIPGVRVVMIESHQPIDSLDRWIAVSEWTRRVLIQTGAMRFVIECELPLYDYWKGDPFNYFNLRKGLWHFPQDVEYIFYPAGLANGYEPNLLKWMPLALNLYREVQLGLKNMRLSAVGPCNHPLHRERVLEQAIDTLLRGEGRKFFDSIYTGSREEYWPIADLGTAISLVRGGEAYLWVHEGQHKEAFDKAAEYFSGL